MWAESVQFVLWQTALTLQLNYLKGTQNHGLVYSQSGEDLVGYADADWSANSDDRKEAVHLRSFLRKVKIPLCASVIYNDH